MPKMPVFVKIEDTSDILDILNLTKDKIKKARYLLEKLNELRAQESETLASWQKQIDDVEQRVVNVDEKMFQER